ncbi:MAG TPA: hypothetical protein VN894_16805 [Polyangiaceae bacterium]|nr:hypothetical protein [Polyangiaceae bacterium]
MDSLPPPPPASDAYVYAPGDIYPRTAHERELCAHASHPDWAYLGGLVGLDVATIWFGSWDKLKYSGSLPLRMSGPAAIGLGWGATVGGAWLALPKCSTRWVASPPLEGDVRAQWPLAVSMALLAGATAPIVNAIAIGTCNPPECQEGLPAGWTTFEREMHLVVAGVAGFAGALLPYLVPPRTWSAAREIERIRFGTDGRGGMFLGYSSRF